MIRKLFPHPGLSVVLILVWLLLWNRFSLGALVLGLLIGVLVPVLTAPYWPNRPKLRFGWAMIDYVVIVLWDVVIANFQVARIILFRRNRDLRSAWLAIPLDVRSPEAITVLAGTISLTLQSSAGVAVDTGQLTLSVGADSTFWRSDVRNQAYRGSIRMHF